MHVPSRRRPPAASARPAGAWPLRVLLVALALAIGFPDVPLAAQDAPAADAAGGAAPGEQDDEPRGLRLRTDRAFPGYTLVAPLNSKQVHLVDLDGQVVHTWTTEYRPGAAHYLLDNGHLLACGHKEQVPRFKGGGIGGVLQELDWDGNVVWQYELASDKSILHHDVAPMPNGNLLVIAWEARPPGHALDRGRDEGKVGRLGLWPDVVHEIEPIRPRGGDIVWTWRAWDHLVQDRDPDKPGYGKLSAFPGRIDINADHRYRPAEEDETDEQRAAREALEKQMQEVGYVGDDGDENEDDLSGDMLHTNSVEYLPEHDLIVLSSPHLCEIFVIDHSTTTEQAMGSTGGKWGKGGELLWRWGNPRNYGHGGEADQRLFYQHNPTWLAGDDGSLRLLVFNNGGKRPDGKEYSSVDELVLPFDPVLGFVRQAGQPWGPAEPVWTYADEGTFFSAFISGAQRLPNGNTLVCEGAKGRVFEVEADGTLVWDWWNPLGGELEPHPQGGRAPPKALFRATRIPADHPALASRL